MYIFVVDNDESTLSQLTDILKTEYPNAVVKTLQTNSLS